VNDPNVVTKAKVVIVVAPKPLGAAQDDSTPAVGVPALSARDTAPMAQADVSTRDTAEFTPPAVSLQETAEVDRAELTARDTAPVAPPRVRDQSDDALAAAVIQVDAIADPNPLDDFLGRSLLFRAARVAADVGAPRLVLVGNLPASARPAFFETAYEGFRGGPVELADSDPGLRAFGRGRVLLLDCSALHDLEAVEKLVQSRGERTSLLLGQHGDGLKIQVTDDRVMDFGGDLSPYDGVLVGAACVPVEDFELLTQVGGKSALKTLMEANRLGSTLVAETPARMFRSGERLGQAQAECFGALASSGNDGLFEDLFGRPIAKQITLKLLDTPVGPSAVSVLAGVAALLAAGLLAMGHPVAALGAAALAIISAILDRSDGELARLRLEDDQRGLDFGLDHVAHAVLFLGMAYGVAHPASGVGDWGSVVSRLPDGLRAHVEPLTALSVGCFAAGAILLLLAVHMVRGEPSKNSTGLRKLGDKIATSFGARDYFYLLLVAAILNLLPGMAELGIMGWFLLGSTALVWVLLAVMILVTLVAPKRA
jgi:hypothetical protein